MMRLLALPLMLIGALALAACANLGFPQVPTPQSLNLPLAQEVQLDPADLSNEQLCTYIAEIEIGIQEWQTYINQWAATAGYDPVNLQVYVDDLLQLTGRAGDIAEQRRLICTQAPPLARSL